MHHPLAHPDIGAWRAWLDDEPADGASEASILSDHLDACTACQQAVADLQEARDLAAATLLPLAPAAVPSADAVALARERLAWRQRQLHRQPVALPAAAATIPLEPQHPRQPAATLTLSNSQEPTPMSQARTHSPLFARWRLAASGLAAALALTLLVGTEDGRAIAAQFLAQFRSERFTVVTVPTGMSEHPFEALAGLGTISGNPDARGEPVASVAEASQQVGFPVKQADPATLPANVSATPSSIQVMQASQFRFTFDQDRARAYLEANGGQGVTLPAKFHGASLVVSVPDVVLMEHGSTQADGARSAQPGLIVGQARALEVTAEGGTGGDVSLDEMRDFLLSLPGLPPETVRQLRAIQDWRTTLPIPVPADSVAWQETTIGGSQGLILNDNSGIGSAAIWQQDGRVYGVAGALKANDIQRIANGLK